MQLGIGTAQFGLDYGISNAAGRLPEPGVGAILARALERGVSLIDTARAYGTAEEVLGRQLPGEGFSVITKLAPGTGAQVAAAELAKSLAALGLERVQALLVHDPGDLDDELWSWLCAARNAGQVGRVGASVYDVDAGLELAARYELDLVQLPINLLDQRALVGGGLEALRQAGIALHGRSAFLQGLLLMEPEDAPLDAARPHLRRVQERARDLGRTPLELALGFMRALPLEAVICGVTSPTELDQLCDAWELPALDLAEVADLALNDLDLIDPSRWEPVR